MVTPSCRAGAGSETTGPCAAELSELGRLDVNLQLMGVCGLGGVPVQLTFLVSCQHSLSPTVRHPVAATPPPLPASPAARTVAGDCRPPAGGASPTRQDWEHALRNSDALLGFGYLKAHCHPNGSACASFCGRWLCPACAELCEGQTEAQQSGWAKAALRAEANPVFPDPYYRLISGLWGKFQTLAAVLRRDRAQVNHLCRALLTSSPLTAAFSIAPRVVSLRLESRGEAGKIISYVQVIGSSACGSVPGEEAGKLF